MTWVLLLIAAWVAVSLPLALLVAHAIRKADQEGTAARRRRPLSVVDPDDPVSLNRATVSHGGTFQRRRSPARSPVRRVGRH
jgi:hypothetical protein